MVHVTESYSSKRTIAIVCDRCKTEVVSGKQEFGAVTSINHRCGYGSVWSDGAHIAADICEPCLQELIGSFCKMTTTDKTSDKGWDSFFNNKEAGSI